MKRITVSLLFLLIPAALSRVPDFLHRAHSCETIQARQCSHMGYNVTRMPNLAGNENQQEAETQLGSYEPLLKFKCSSQLHFFLCSVYFPMCNHMVEDSIGPCRPLCESVRRRCEPALKTFGFDWPEILNCSKFPNQNSPVTMCMKGPPELELDRDGEYPIPGSSSKENVDDGGGNFAGFPGHPGDRVPTIPIGFRNNVRCKNVPVLFHDLEYIYVNTTGRCAPKCGSKILFTPAERNIATAWMGSLVGISILLTISALVTLLVSSQTLSYPERAVVFITLCNGLTTVAYLIRFFSGHNAVACTFGDTVGQFLVVQGLQNLKCTIIFVFYYYFSLVASMWWLIMCGTLFFVTVPKWSSATLDKRATIYHVLAWIVPGLLTIVILVRQTVEADDLTGLCNVGNVNVTELLQFLILPNLICLIFGMVLLLLAFLAAVCCSGNNGFLKSPERSTSPQLHGMHNAKFSGPMLLRLGILAVFYIVPSVCMIAAHFYEYSNRPYWIPTVPEKTLRAQVRAGNRKAVTEGPNFETFVMKICVSLIYGMCTALWLIVRVTCTSCSPRPAKPLTLAHPYASQADTPLTSSSASNRHSRNQRFTPSPCHPPPPTQKPPNPRYYNGTII